MTTNRLAKTAAQPKRTTQEWIDRGNRILWGQEVTAKGDFLPPRFDLEWVHRNGSYSIDRRAKQA